MQTNYHEYEIDNTPALVKVGKILIKINAKKVNMIGTDDVFIESKTNLTQIAPRIDLNPDKAAPTREEMEAMAKSMIMQAQAEHECCEEGHQH